MRNKLRSGIPVYDFRTRLLELPKKARKLRKTLISFALNGRSKEARVLEVNAVLFDLGGTLHHYHREEVFRTILKEKGIEVRASEVLRAYDVTDPIFARLTAELPQEVMWPDSLLEQLDLMMVKEIGITEDCEKLASYIRQNWDRVDRQLPKSIVRTPYPDAVPCVEATNRLGLRMGIVSNIPSEERLRNELEAIGLVKFFPILVSSGSVGVSKPDKRIFHLAAKKIDEPPDRILFVGDDLQRDYYGAIHAGMKAVLIDRRGALTDDTGVCRLSSLEQLPQFLDDRLTDLATRKKQRKSRQNRSTEI